MTRGFAFATVDVSTDQRFSGNPLAVLPDAEGLTDAEMQALAGGFNLDENTFVLRRCVLGFRDPAPASVAAAVQPCSRSVIG